MPKIPTYLASVGYQPPRGDVAAAGAPGKALAKFGEAVGAFGGSVAAAAQRRAAAEQAAAEVERANGSAQSMKALHQTIEDFTRDTDPATVMDRYQLRVGNMRQEITGTIRSSEARAEVETTQKTLADVQATVLRGDSLRRLAEQGRNDLAGNLDLYAETAAAARHPVQHDDAVDLALREIANKTAAGFLTAEDADRLEQSFTGDLAQRQARLAIAADPLAALASLQRQEDFAALDSNSRARLTAEAGRAVQARTVRQATETAALRRDTLSRLPAYLDSLRDGGLPDDARFNCDNVIATLGEAAGGKTWAEIEQARDFGEVMARVKWATPDEIDDLIDGGDQAFVEMKLPEVLGGGDKVSAEHLFELAVARRDRQLRDKPADTMLANPHIAELHGAMVQAMAQPALPPAIATAMRAGGNTATPSAADLSQDDRRATIAAYANATLAEQERLGVPENRRQILPESMAQEIVTGILGGDAASADRTLRDLAKNWGETWPRVLGDLKRAGLSPEHAELAARKNPVSRQTLAEVLAIQTAEPGALRAQTGADADGIDDLIHRHRAGPAGQFLSDDRVKLVKLLAYRYARFTEPEEAVRRAIADFTGDIILTVGSEGKSEADDIADAWRDKGAKLRPNRPPGTSIFDYIVDLEKGAIGGARKGIQNAIDLLAESGNELNQYVLDKTGVDLTIDADFKWPVLPETPPPETEGGKVAEKVGEFLIGFGPILKALRFARGGAASSGLGAFAEMEFAAAAASAITLDPLEKRLANFWNEHGLPQNILTDYLEAKPDDTRAEGALKNAIESLGLGAAVGGGFFLGTKLLRALKNAEKAKEEASALGSGEAQPVASLPRVPIIEVDPSNIKNSIVDFVARAFRDRKPALLRLGRVPDSVAEQAEKQGVNIRGFDHVIQTDDIRHAFNAHGPGAAKRDEIPLTSADIARIPEIVETGELRKVDPSHLGLTVFHFVKREPDGTVFVVEEVRVGKRRMAFKTMYRLKRGGGGGS